MAPHCILQPVLGLLLATQVKEGAWQGSYQLVYLTPELALSSRDSLHLLHQRRGISLLAVDEAHCVSEWSVV
jgi:superfamily II DNA helicase RecQ